jgi:hypothetical protein
MVIYEWKDVKYLGVITSELDDSLPVSSPLTTRPAVSAIVILAEDLRMHNRCSQSRFLLSRKSRKIHFLV